MPIYDFLSDFEYVLEVSTPGLDRKFFYFDQLKNILVRNFLLSLKDLLMEGN